MDLRARFHPQCVLLFVLTLLIGLQLPGTTAFSQTPARISNQLRDLSRRVEELEREAGERESLISPEGEEITKIKLELRLPESLGKPFTGLAPSASHAFLSRLPLRFGLLGEMRWIRPLGGDAAQTAQGTSTDISRFITFVSTRFSNNLAASAAFAVHESNALDAQPLSSAIRFAHIDYRWDTETGLRVGNYLVPIGVHNLRFDPYVFPTVRPPLVETLIIPSPWNENGLLFYAREGNIIAQAGVMAGFDASRLDAKTWLRGGRQGAVARAESAAGVARVEWLDQENSLGLSSYYGEGNQGDPRLGSTHAFLWEAHGEFRQGRFRGKALYTEGTLDGADRVSNVTSQAIGTRAQGWEAHLAYDLLPRLAPLVRDLAGRPAPPDWKEMPVFISWQSVDPQAEVAAGLTSDPRSRLDALTFGLNYRPHPQVIFKLDHALETNGLDEVARIYEIGAGFAF